MEFDYKAAGFWFDVLQWASIGLIAIWGYLRTKDNDNATALKHVADELAAFIKASAEANQEQDNRLTVMEETVKHLPTRKEQSALGAELAALSADFGGMKQLLERVEHQTNLIHDHLLNKR